MNALAHVMIRVTDLDRALDFYCGVLGLREAFRLHRDDGTVGIIYLHVAGRQFVELSRAAADAIPTSSAGYAHMCFEVEDIESEYARLLPSGYVIENSLKKGRDGSMQFWMRDPDGNRIEFMQYTSESMQTAFLDRLASERS